MPGVVVSCFCGCMNGASPVRFVLSLLYMCAFQMNWGLFLVYLFVTEVTHPNDWSVFVCVFRRARI